MSSPKKRCNEDHDAEAGGSARKRRRDSTSPSSDSNDSRSKSRSSRSKSSSSMSSTGSKVSSETWNSSPNSELEPSRTTNFTSSQQDNLQRGRSAGHRGPPSDGRDESDQEPTSTTYPEEIPDAPLITSSDTDTDTDDEVQDECDQKPTSTTYPEEIPDAPLITSSDTDTDTDDEVQLKDYVEEQVSKDQLSQIQKDSGNSSDPNENAGASEPEEAGGSSKPEEPEKPKVEEEDQDMLELHERPTPELEEIEAPPIPGPSVRKRGITNPQNEERPKRMTLLPPKHRASRMSVHSPERSRLKLIPKRKGILRRQDSPCPGSSSAQRTAVRAQAAHSGSPEPQRRQPRGIGYRDLSRAIPRTRVLVTPERSTPPRLPSKRKLCTPQGSPDMSIGKAMRAASKKRQLMRTARRQQRRRQIELKTNPTPASSSSSDIDSSGLDSSGGNSADASSADEAPTSKTLRKKFSTL